MKAAAAFGVDRKLLETLEELRAHFGWQSREVALRKSVALMKIASENEDPDGSITLRKGVPLDSPALSGQQGEGDLKIKLR